MADFQDHRCNLAKRRSVLGRERGKAVLLDCVRTCAVVAGAACIMVLSTIWVLKASAEQGSYWPTDFTPTAFEYLPLVARNYPPTPTSTHTPMPTSTPTPTRTPTPTNTPRPTSTPSPVTTGNIVIIDIFYDGSGSREPDEHVDIRNDDSRPIQLENWTLRDIANHVYTFPTFVIQPGQVCRIYTNENHPEWCGFNYGSGSAIWNNTGDCAYLRDSTGREIDTYCYGQQ